MEPPPAFTFRPHIFTCIYILLFGTVGLCLDGLMINWRVSPAVGGKWQNKALWIFLIITDIKTSSGVD